MILAARVGIAPSKQPFSHCRPPQGNLCRSPRRCFCGLETCRLKRRLILKISHTAEDMSILKISIRQIKAARSLLGWSQDDLASHSGISKPTIGRLESIDSDDPIGGRPETGESLVTA